MKIYDSISDLAMTAAMFFFLLKVEMKCKKDIKKRHKKCKVRMKRITKSASEQSNYCKMEPKLLKLS